MGTEYLPAFVYHKTSHWSDMLGQLALVQEVDDGAPIFKAKRNTKT